MQLADKLLEEPTPPLLPNLMALGSVPGGEAAGWALSVPLPSSVSSPERAFFWLYLCLCTDIL